MSMWILDGAIFMKMANGNDDVVGLTWEGIEKNYCDKRDRDKLVLGTRALIVLFAVQLFFFSWYAFLHQSAPSRQTNFPAGLTQEELNYVPGPTTCQ